MPKGPFPTSIVRHNSVNGLDTAFEKQTLAEPPRKKSAVPTSHALQSATLKEYYSPFQKMRQKAGHVLPTALQSPVAAVNVDERHLRTVEAADTLAKLFPKTWGASFVKLVPQPGSTVLATHAPMRVGVVLSGGQAPGGHNVIAGVYDYIKKANSNSQLFGFLGGPHGIFSHKYMEISDEYMNKYRNQGGFDMICSGRHKIETVDQKTSSMQVCMKLDLHGLIVIGGDDSNTNAAILAEFFLENGWSTKVVGCPKTIDGDLRNEYIETSFGFDTACKTYSELIGNLCTDVATSQSHYHFVRLMGRSASNITLECAMQTRCNLAFIGEEVQDLSMSLNDLVQELVEMIIKRQDMGKNYGVVLLSEGLIEFIKEIGVLIREINDVIAATEGLPDGSKPAFDDAKLSAESRTVFKSLPEVIREELLLERDPHGNVQVARIATERLLILMVETELTRRGRAKNFTAVPHYFGYEGRCAVPSLFDANYSYSLGHVAGALVDCGKTGYMAVVRYLDRELASWEPAGCPLTYMMEIERRKGKDVPVIRKYLVDIQEHLFKLFAQVRDEWKVRDCYRNPGPIQFEGPTANDANFTIIAPSREDLLPHLPNGYANLKDKFHFVRCENALSRLCLERSKGRWDINPLLLDPRAVLATGSRAFPVDQQTHRAVTQAFPLQTLKNQFAAGCVTLDDSHVPPSGLRVGVVLVAQPSPGCQNVLVGLAERLAVTGGTLIGFKGATGLLEGSFVEVTKEDVTVYANQGGFELLGRTEETEDLIRTAEGLEKIVKTCETLKLNGLVLIGGTYAMTDVGVVAEHLLSRGLSTGVVGVPATQNNNIKHPMVETCIGFDSTSKCYASLIGNLLTDAASATKYWYFVRLMGRDPSHVVIEAALQTHPNMSIVAEEYASEDATLDDVVKDVADNICSRAAIGKNFGTVLVPEGLVSHLPQMRQLVNELNKVILGLPESDVPQLMAELVEFDGTTSKFASFLSPWALALMKSFPSFYRKQLLQPRANGRLKLSKIATEELLAHLVGIELDKRAKEGEYEGKYAAISHYFGYQGRCTIPSFFDCALAVSHGCLAAIMIEGAATGYMSSVRGLCGPSVEWRMAAVPVGALMKIVPERETKVYGRHVPIVPSHEADLKGRAFRALKAGCDHWGDEDRFCNPGPIQFFGKSTSNYSRNLYEEHHNYLKQLQEVEHLAQYIASVCAYGVDEMSLKTAALTLESLKNILNVQRTASLPLLCPSLAAPSPSNANAKDDHEPPMYN